MCAPMNHLPLGRMIRALQVPLNGMLALGGVAGDWQGEDAEGEQQQ